MTSDQALWDGTKLDRLLRIMERRVTQGCASKNTREVEDAEVLGYWYYQLKYCRLDPKGKRKP